MTRKENREGTNVLFVLAKVAAMAAVYYCMATLYGAFASLDSKMNRVAQLDCRLELTQTCHTHTHTRTIRRLKVELGGEIRALYGD